MRAKCVLVSVTTNQRATVSEREKERGGRIVDQTNRSDGHHIAQILFSSLAGGGGAAAVHFHHSLTRHSFSTYAKREEHEKRD